MLGWKGEVHRLPRCVNGILGLGVSESSVLSWTKGDAKSKRSSGFWGQKPGFCGSSGVRMLISAAPGLAEPPPPHTISPGSEKSV